MTSPDDARINSARPSLSSALARYEDVSSRGEAALLSRDPAARLAWLADMERAEAEVNAARTAPSWESLMRDPLVQIAGADEVTASILAYQDAPLASACACGGTLHKTCGKGSR